MTKTKILFLITKGNWGGSQKYVFELAKSLKKDNSFDISVAFGEPDVLEERLREENIRTLHLKKTKNNINFLEVYSSLKEIIDLIRREKPDIIHLNSSKAGYFGSFCAKYFSDTKIVFTSHGWPYNENRNFLVRYFLKILMTLTVFWSNKIIAVSKKIERETPFYNFFKEKIIQIYFGIENKQPVSKEEALNYLKFEKVEDRVDIVTIAELNDNKGYSYALKAIKNIVHNEQKNIHYHIIGNGKNKEKIESLIKKYNLELNVTMHGFVKDACKYLKAFDIFLLPSTTEALGYVVLEAGIAGIPVVATNVGGVPEIVENNVTGLLAKRKDAKDIRDKLIEMIDDESKRNLMANNLNKKVLKEFTLDKTTEETKKLYKSMVC